MKKDDSLKIIGMIVDGLDPYGEHNPNSLPEMNPITTRAICTAILSLVSKNDMEILRSKYVAKKPHEYAKVLKGPIALNFQNKQSNKLRPILEKYNFNLKLAAKELGLDTAKMREKRVVFEIEALILAKKFSQLQKTSPTNIDQYLTSIESASILEALKVTSSHKKAAYLLGITPRALKYKINKLHLKSRPYPRQIEYLKYLEHRSLDIFIKEIEKEIILNALEATHNRQTKASELLGITYRSLRYRMEKYGIFKIR